MTQRIFEAGQRVAVTIHDWERGERTLAGDVRRMTRRDQVEVLLDPGADPDDPDERLTAFVGIGDVLAIDEERDRRAA